MAATIQCPRCEIAVTPEEVQSGFSPVCPECDDTDPEQSGPDPVEDELVEPSARRGQDDPESRA